MLKRPEPTGEDDKARMPNELGSADVIQEWVDATMKTAVSLDPQSYIPELFWANKTRPDGRIFGQARRTSITTNVLERNSLGSALVRLSPTEVAKNPRHATHVLAGVTAEVGQPSDQEGDLKITCAPNNAPLESWLQRLLLKIIDLEQFCILPGKAAFGLSVSIAVLDQDGNIPDACLLAAMAALRNTTLPPIVVQEGRVFTLESEDERNNLPSSWTTFPSKRLSLPMIPLPLSLGVMRIPQDKQEDEAAGKGGRSKEKQHWVVDPSREEETVCKGGITIVVNGCNLNQVLSLDYQGKVSITQSNLALALKMAQGRAKELLPLLQEDN